MNVPANAATPSQPALPPGPPAWKGISNLKALRKDALSFLLQMSEQYGGVCRFYVGYIPITFVSDPDAVRHVVQENHRNYNKQTRGFAVLRELLGNGLLTSEGSFWLRQRRLAQPAFHRQRLSAFAGMISDAAKSLSDDWSRRTATPFDLTEDMMKLTLVIVSRALFGTDLGAQAGVVDEAFSAALEYAKDRLTQIVMLPRWIPTPGNLKANAALGQLNGVVYGVIEKRRSERQEGRHDLLAMLMEAKDEDTGEQMSNGQLRDEVMTLMLAGHETSANALSWTFALLSKNPDARTKLEAEVDALGGKTPGVEDLMKLPYTKAVLDEAMRLYPPAWSFSRSPESDDLLNGFKVHKGSIVLMSSYVTHHNPTLYPDPFAFEPERFLHEKEKTQPRFAYYPFGGGPRLCIGNNFALMEMALVLAILTQRFRVELEPDQQLVPDAMITLRPKGGLRVRVAPRAAV